MSTVPAANPGIRARVTGGFDPAPRRTVQQFEMDDDLGDNNATFGYGGKAVPGVFRRAGAIWPAASSRVNFSVYADTPQQVDLEMLMPGSAPIAVPSGAATPTVPLAISVNIPAEGRYILQARLSNAAAPPARLYIKVDYLGPAESTLF